MKQSIEAWRAWWIPQNQQYQMEYTGSFDNWNLQTIYTHKLIVTCICMHSYIQYIWCIYTSRNLFEVAFMHFCRKRERIYTHWYTHTDTRADNATYNPTLLVDSTDLKSKILMNLSYPKIFRTYLNVYTECFDQIHVVTYYIYIVKISFI